MNEPAPPRPDQLMPEADKQRFQALQELSLDGLAIVRSLRDEAGRVIDFTGAYLNPVAERLAGRPLAELRGRRMTQIFPGTERNGLLARYLQVFESGEPQAFEQHYDADGFSAWYRNMVVRLNDGLAIIFSDITAQKQTEAALRASEERFRQLAAAVDSIFWIADSVDQKLLYLSPAYEQITGRSGAALFESFFSWFEAIHPDDRERVASAYSERVYDGTYEDEFRIVRPDGSVRWIRDRGFPIRDTSGRITQAAGIAEDITRRKQAELERTQLLTFTTALAAALTPAQVAEAIFENIHLSLGAQFGVVVLLSEDGGSLEILGTMGFPPELTARWQRFPIDMPIPLVETTRSGQPVWAESPDEVAARFPSVHAAMPLAGAIASLPLTIQQRVIGALGVSFARPRAFQEEDKVHLQVIAQQCALALERAWLYESERRAHLAAEEAVRTRDDLLAMVSHDLRNPLTVILGQAQLMVKQADRFGEAGREIGPRLTMIRDMVTQIDGQLDDLLDTARLRSRQALTLNPEPLDLVALVREAVLSAQATSSKHQVRLTAPEGALLCLGDQRRLGRVLANLLRNAIIYSPAGGPVSVAVTRRSDEAGSWGEVSVTDTGVGIPAADLPLVFEQFYRGSNVAGRIRGTGLGLASARQIVEQHEGRIAVSSVEGAGSTFTISLPCPDEE